MRPWAAARRLLALAVTLVFMLGVLAMPALAAGSKGFSSGSRSFSSPKSSAPSRSYSAPKPSTPAPKPSTPSAKPAPSRSFSSPPPSGTTTPGRSYSSPPQNYSSGDRSYSTPDRSFSTERPSTPGPGTTPPPVYDRGTTRYPTRPPVVIYAPTPYPPVYWHDYYYGQPWYWRMWHRPVYYGTDGGGWGISWLSVVGFGIGIWILLGFVSAIMAKRRRR
jgi:hypothetical protein